MNIFKDFFLAFFGDEDAQRVAKARANANKNTTVEPELDCYDPDESEMFNTDFDDEYFE